MSGTERAGAAPLEDRGRLYVVSSDEMRGMDRRTIELGTPGEVLMERAGALAVEVLRERFATALRRGVVVVAGKGNNGGDALVMARHLRRRRAKVEVFLAAGADEFGGDARTQWLRWTRAGGRAREIGGAGGLAALAAAAGRAGVVVDGLFGTGLRGGLDERSRAIVATLNASSAPILAVDVPSGLDADRGVALGDAVQATLTVTFAYPKIGLLVHPGAELAGEVVVVDIGIDPRALAEVAPRQRLLTPRAVAAALPPRAPDGHKGSYGHVLVLAGAVGKSGAALLCARGALRGGAGLATLAAPAPALGPVLAHTPELMTEPLADHDGGWAFSSDDQPRLLRLFDGKSAAVFGPGVGTSPLARALTEWLIGASPLPLVIDADGLNCLAGQVGWLKHKRCPIVLTPHPGEMARLLAGSPGEVQADRIGSARRLATTYDAVVVLKGARTVIAAPDGVVSINPTGNPGMASGGMGDALAGLIGSLLAQGLAPAEAAEAAAFWHGAAADRVAARRGQAGLLATDVIEELPPTLRDLQARLFADAPGD
ncbi:MAG: NAD(P)H-hydrate dehydratase [Deltaproteobacteria bacterium]|nr:NAD(P)H-hydrate dehydratase [Deltaproteobacteria bacterium]